MKLGKILLVAVASFAFVNPADARPRVLKVLRALTVAPVAIVAGAVHARAHHRRQAVRRPAAEPRPVNVASWAGPVFWPYAYDDMFSYVFGQQGAADRFWAHGYNDVLDGMFVTAALPGTRSRVRMARQGQDGAPPSWQGLCASELANPAERIAEHIRGVVQPRPEQNAAFDTLQAALTRAHEYMQAACPDIAVINAPERLDLMSARLLAMRQALTVVNTPLKNFYAALDDAQKARLNGGNQNESAPPSPGAAATPPAQGAMGCAEAAETDWPTARLVRRVAPQREQMKDLEILRGTSDVFAKFVATTCTPDKALTAPERLDAALKRVNVLRYAVRHVSPALDQFYGSLGDGQKMRFSGLGR